MSDNTVLIRAQEPEDIPAVNEVLSQPRALWGTLQTPWRSIEARRKLHAAQDEGGLALVGLIGGRVVGTAGLGPTGRRRRAHAASIGMAVHDDFTGRGVGGALLGALLTAADDWLNYRRVELTVWTDNDRAIALYERFGFEREGVHRAYAWRDGAYADALAMARLRL